VPNVLERDGDFSQSFDVNGKLFGITDPLNNQSPFPGNRIPANRLDASGRNILKLFPLPNYVDATAANRNQWNYISDESWSHPRRSQTARIDYVPKSGLLLYGRFGRYTDEEHNPYGSGANYDLTPVVQRQPGWSATLHAAATFSPTLFGEFIAGLTRSTREDVFDDPKE
jgi:hypothetical protein